MYQRQQGNNIMQTQTGYSLEFLCWINRCLFPKDFKRDLIDLGVDNMVAYTLSTTLERHSRDILVLYQAYGLHEGEYKDAVDTYLAHMLNKWNEYENDS